MSAALKRDQAEIEKQTAGPHVDDITTPLDGASAGLRPVVPQSASQAIIARLHVVPQKQHFLHPRSDAKTSKDAIVDFEGPDDIYNPINWSNGRKLTTLSIYASSAMGTSFNSAIFSSVDTQVARVYGVGHEVTALGTTTILLGFALGPLVWAPLSEVYGRKYTVMLPYLVASFFAFGCGAAANIETILITRFFQGFFSGAVITNTGGVLSDIYAPKDRGNALIVYSLSVVGGPLLAPIIGSAIVTSHLKWRWTMYLVGIIQVFTATLALIVLDETYAPVLLQRKARSLRCTTGNWSLHAKHEEWSASLAELATRHLTRPFRLLGSPICFLMSFYASFVYGLIYGSLSAIPIVFDRRGWSPVVASLPFLALLLGCVLGLAGNTFNQKAYLRAMAANNGKPVPEARLYPMMVGSFLLVAGLFVFGWTGEHKIWIVPCIGIVLIGAGFFPIFQACLNYIIDTFLPVAASAVATTTFMRSLFAASFPLFVRPMLESLGIAWGLSLLGFVGTAMLPVPFFFYFFGSRIRAHSSFAMPVT